MPIRNKTYYYCRVFFAYYDDPRINNILRRTNGAEIIILHQKLLMAVANSDNVYRYYGDDNDADHVDEIAHLLRIKSNVVREGLDILYRYGLVEPVAGGIYVPFIPELIDTGSLTAEAIKKQKQRARNALENKKGDNRGDNVPPEIEIKSEIESETLSSSYIDDGNVCVIIDAFNASMKKKYKKSEKNMAIVRSALERVTLAEAEAIIKDVHTRYESGDMGTFTPNIAWVFGDGLSECIRRLHPPDTPPKKAKNAFLNYPQRDYDMDALERELLGE